MPCALCPCCSNWWNILNFIYLKATSFPRELYSLHLITIKVNKFFLFKLLTLSGIRVWCVSASQFHLSLGGLLSQAFSCDKRQTAGISSGHFPSICYPKRRKFYLPVSVWKDCREGFWLVLIRSRANSWTNHHGQRHEILNSCLCLKVIYDPLPIKLKSLLFLLSLIRTMFL